jgi:hypothetical protein
MTKRAILLVQTNPVSPDRESEFNEWYEGTHIPQILGNVPGMIGASRYVIADSSPSTPRHRYLAVYDIEADDPAAVVRALGEAVAAGRVDISDVLDMSDPGPLTLYEATGDGR